MDSTRARVFTGFQTKTSTMDRGLMVLCTELGYTPILTAVSSSGNSKKARSRVVSIAMQMETYSRGNSSMVSNQAGVLSILTAVSSKETLSLECASAAL